MANALGRMHPDDQELRLALVLNGGVSLAVWIGGVVHEINGCVQRQGRAYAGLLDLTATSPRVDVISGSSAGGLNGALLAEALIHGQPLDPLRELWTHRAGFGDLLRDPFERNPPSVLDGDGYFLEELQSALEGLRRGAARQPAEVPIDLTLTGTLLKSRGAKLWDDFGAVISDRTHRCRFHFVRNPEGRDDFANPESVEALALAARSTASFPVAFEPSFCPGTPEGARTTGRPSMAPFTSIAEDRFIVDGGVLDNKPFQPALDAIFAQRSPRDVRRVLAYIVPDAESGAEQRTDNPDFPPSISRVAIASLTELPRVESVSEELQQLRDRNMRVQQLRRARIDLTTNLEPEEVDGLARTLFPVYRRRRIDASVSYMLSEISGELAQRDGRGLGYRGRREWLQRELSESRLPWIPAADAASYVSAEMWDWGTRPGEYAKNVVVDALRRTQRLARLTRAHTDGLQVLWSRALDVQDDLDVIRSLDRSYWRKTAAELGDGIGRGTGDRNAAELRDAIRRWMRDTIDGWTRQEVAMKRPRGRGTLTWTSAVALLVNELANIMFALSKMVDELTRATAALDPMMARDADELQSHLKYFVRDASDSEPAVIRRLLQLEVITRATGHQDDEQEQVVELAQFSADGGSPLGGPEKASQKLAGLQIAHFGAFYKRSWRANDWMFGRLDASARLVKIVLSPERLKVVSGAGPGSAAAVLSTLEDLAFFGIDEAARRSLTAGWDRADALRELKYLDDPSLPVPEYLPACEELVTRRLHVDILREELDAVHTECVQDRAAGAVQTGSGGPAFIATFMAKLPHGLRASNAPLQTVTELFKACSVGTEKIAAEVGTDLFTAISSRSLAIAVAAGEGESSGLGPLRAVLKIMRAPVLGAYLVARALVLRSRTAVAAFGLAFAFSATILVTRAAGWLQPPPLLFSAAVATAIALVVAFALWRYKVVAVVATVCAGACVLYLYFTGRFGWPGWSLETWRRLTTWLAILLAAAVFPWPARLRRAILRRLRRAPRRAALPTSPSLRPDITKR